MVGLDLAAGGPTWAGWRLGPYGRARDWRLLAPDGQHYQASELQDLHALQLDVDWLRMRVRELETAAAGPSSHELQILQTAAMILHRFGAAALTPQPPGPRRVFTPLEVMSQILIRQTGGAHDVALSTGF